MISSRVEQPPSPCTRQAHLSRSMRKHEYIAKSTSEANQMDTRGFPSLNFRFTVVYPTSSLRSLLEYQSFSTPIQQVESISITFVVFTMIIHLLFFADLRSQLSQTSHCSSPWELASDTSKRNKCFKGLLDTNHKCSSYGLLYSTRKFSHKITLSTQLKDYSIITQVSQSDAGRDVFSLQMICSKNLTINPQTNPRSSQTLSLFTNYLNHPKFVELGQLAQSRDFSRLFSHRSTKSTLDVLN